MRAVVRLRLRAHLSALSLGSALIEAKRHAKLGVSVPNGPKGNHRLDGLPPQGRLIAVKPLESTAVEVGEPQAKLSIRFGSAVLPAK